MEIRKMSDIILYDYWRSSASYRVRIALNLKELDYFAHPVDLLTKSHQDPEYLEKNPQGLLPAVEIDGFHFTQSLAIIEYLDETRPEHRLVPNVPIERARVRALSHAIAMEIHPVCNLSVAAHVTHLTGGGEAGKKAWMQHFILKGLTAFEAMLQSEFTGLFCHGNEPTMADCCLIPQLYNADRWDVSLDDMPRISAIRKRCDAMGAFQKAHPDEIGPPPKDDAEEPA